MSAGFWVSVALLAAAAAAGAAVRWHGTRAPRHAARSGHSHARRDERHRDFWDTRDTADPGGSLWLAALARGPGYDPLPAGPHIHHEQPGPALHTAAFLPSPAPPTGMPWPPAPRRQAGLPPLAALVRAAPPAPDPAPAEVTAGQAAVTCELGGKSPAEVIDDIFAPAETAVAALTATLAAGEGTPA